MFSGLDEGQLAGAVEALLFVTDEPIGVTTLAMVLETEPALVDRALRKLQLHYETENRGIQLREAAGGWRLYTHPRFHELLEHYVLSWDTRKLSNAALETLAIVAYLQPVTRAGVASVRGVNSDSSIVSLLDKGLIREAGTADLPGNPMLYATTRAFLEKFGLRSTAELPDIADFAPDEETKAFIRERLGATMPEDAVFPTDESSGQEPSDHEGAAEQGEASGGAQPEGDAVGKAMLADALASSFGLVEKIDFDSLVFETDDE